MKTTIIEKEQLPLLPLYPIKERNSSDFTLRLNEAVLLSNTDKNKCKITVLSHNGLITVNTTIWYASNEHICLKGGITVPIKCIYDIEL